MIFISQHQIDSWLLEDIQGGDITTRALDIGQRHGVMTFSHRQGGCVSGIAIALQMLRTPGLEVMVNLRDGDIAQPGDQLLSARGTASGLESCAKCP